MEFFNKIILKIKEFLYSTLTEENIDILIRRKEEEIEDVEALEEQEITSILREFREELEFEEKYSDEEMDLALVELGERLREK